MIKKFLLYAILFWSTVLALRAQPGTGGNFGNQIPRFCQCITFRHACTDNVATLPGVRILSSCNSGSFNITPRVISLAAPFSRYCRRNDCGMQSQEGICLRYGNWHICDYNGCNARIFQTLSNFPTINNQLIGNGQIVRAEERSLDCIGNIFPGPLNDINSRTKLNICPGDNAILQLPGLDISEESGLCLEVSIKTVSGQLLSSKVYSHNEVNFGSADISSLMERLNPTTYIIEMHLRCCNDVQTCSTNTFKSAFIELSGPLSFSSFLSQGGGSSNCNYFASNLTSSSPGTAFLTPLKIEVLPDGSFTVLRNCPVLLSINNVINPNNKPFIIKLFRLNNCANQIGGDQLLFSEQVNLTNQGYSIPLVALKISSTCECYRLVFEREGCNASVVRDTAYLRVGDDCPPNLIEGHGASFKKATDEGISIRPNPVKDAIILDLHNDLFAKGELLKFTVFDLYGRAVHAADFNAVKGQIHQDVSSLKPGSYIYVIECGELRSTGKFVKM